MARLVVLFTLLSAGCATTFMRVAEGTDLVARRDCTSTPAFAIMSGTVAVTGAGTGIAMLKESAFAENPTPLRAAGLISLGIAAVFLADAAKGYVWASDCPKEKAVDDSHVFLADALENTDAPENEAPDNTDALPSFLTTPDNTDALPSFLTTPDNTDALPSFLTTPKNPRRDSSMASGEATSADGELAAR